jgi:hypothetical protein
MYLKKSYRKSTGRTYLVIAQKYRDPETGISTDRTVKSLGYLDELEKFMMTLSPISKRLLGK